MRKGAEKERNEGESEEGRHGRMEARRQGGREGKGESRRERGKRRGIWRWNGRADMHSLKIPGFGV